MKQLVITAVGPDRPGLVHELSGFLHAAGANLADSRMVNLRGQFAVILLAEVDDARAAAVEKDTPPFGESIGLNVTVWPDEDESDDARTGQSYRLKTSAMDQPGIVHRITNLLHKRNVNIEELQTRLEPGTYSGSPRFAMEMTISAPGAPGDPTTDALRGELAELCDSFNCNLELDPLD